ncbi:TetR/AcrR family transcriptional regulator [Stenotrophomonas sp. PS02289]|uniref:TetR/AcrR family transcriptional regulator n=1 Tax=Stenotrophomonas sp. PS02289 TaxID=2991422 RepID=UPI00249BF518|nr:TetR/AcrR family transcriptional regulator [Stenotrophomonas sp. PS02289]
MKNRRPQLAQTARKRPSQRRSVATVDAIIESAARILEARGHAGYNTNDIAQLAGVSIGTLYQYFPNKDAITNALLLRELRALSDALLTDAAAGSEEEGLERMIETAVRHQLGRSGLNRLLEVEEVRLQPDLALTEARAELEALVKSFFERSRMLSDSCDFVAEDVFAIVRGMVDSAGFRGESDEEALILRVKAAAFGYLQFRRS